MKKLEAIILSVVFGMALFGILTIYTPYVLATEEIIDLNEDGYADIIFSNSYNGTTSNINSYIYWGSSEGYNILNRIGLPTHGAWTNRVADLNQDGYPDIIFANHYDDTTHNINSYIYWGSSGGYSIANRTELPTHGAVGNSIADLNQDGYLDIIFSNYFDDTTHNINSYIYWGSSGSYSIANRTELPTHGAFDNSIADLNQDGYPDIVFSNFIDDITYNISSYIYWGSSGGYSIANRTELPTLDNPVKLDTESEGRLKSNPIFIGNLNQLNPTCHFTL